MYRLRGVNQCTARLKKDVVLPRHLGQISEAGLPSEALDTTFSQIGVYLVPVLESTLMFVPQLLTLFFGECTPKFRIAT